MKYATFILLSSIFLALVLAFPDNKHAVDGSGDVGVHDDAHSSTGTQGDASPSQTNQLRQPRHLLKKLFRSEPQVIIQPILVQPQPYYVNRNPNTGAGRGYNGGVGYNNWQNI